MARQKPWEVMMDYEALQVRPLTNRIGAELSGVDLTRPLSNREVVEIQHAFAEHQVVFFRDQELDPESHIRLGRQFGDLVVHTCIGGADQYPEIVNIHADETTERVIGEDWHSDLSCDVPPPRASILYLHTVPEVGGDTLFSSMYAAYEGLSPRMKAYLEGLEAMHDANPAYKAFYPDDPKTYPANLQPVIRVHPVTGRKGLFVNTCYTTHIKGLPKAESDAILAFLFKHVENPNFHVRFKWRPHSVAIWDNLCTQHLAVADYWPQVRSGRRVIVA